MNLDVFLYTEYHDRREKVFLLRSKQQGLNCAGGNHHIVGFRVDAIYK